LNLRFLARTDAGAVNPEPSVLCSPTPATTRPPARKSAPVTPIAATRVDDEMFGLEATSVPPPRTRRATTIANVVDAFADGTASRILDMKKINVPTKKNPISGRPIGSRLILRPLRSP